TSNECLWSESPWSGAIRDGQMYGRGSCDMKAGVTANIFAIQALQALGHKPAGDVLVESVIGEESGGGRHSHDHCARIQGRCSSHHGTNAPSRVPGAVGGAELSDQGFGKSHSRLHEATWGKCHRKILRTARGSTKTRKAPSPGI